MNVVDTERLCLRWLEVHDAAFMLELVNEPAWLQFIGDKGVRTLDDARRYLETGPIAMYARHGFGLFAVVEKASGAPAGICGLLKRDTLDDVDLGFAFLRRHWGRGFARESATATLELARSRFALRRVVALTALENTASIRLLEKLGFRFERIIRHEANGPESRLFGLALEVTKPVAQETEEAACPTR